MNVSPQASYDSAAGLAGMHDALVAANINPKTGLSTDYLNHFNEMVMLVELYPSSSDLKDEILGWRPANYRTHFENSGFRARTLALLGHDLAHPAVKRQLDIIVAEIDTVLLEAQHAVASETRHGDANEAIAEAVDATEMLIARASALINGLAAVEEASADDAQAAVDALFGG